MKKFTVTLIVYGLLLVGCSHKEQLETSDSAVKSNLETKIDEDSKKSTEPVTKVYDKEIGMWLKEINAMLSAPLDDPRLKEANNDEGFEYYLKAQKVMELYPNTEVLSGTEFGIEYENLFLLSSYIGHVQFVRTAHLDSYGQAKEDTSLSDQWKPTEDDMRQAFEYMRQLVNDLNIAFNHGGKGETFGVTHLLKGDKVSELEAFVTGESSRME
ncbi:hypothetical protein CSV71_05540 [Sporosarcina sp. P21c]|uniref:hypothetical protein n=1 Tax=unclassified Sporosarcina TaxID=2647733 RepID=UPI000C16AB7E|nr:MULTISPECIES: hypothetical protein [unclassified Sporosarcina]PIC66196.1 hypothetical protein CSV78_13560 [Sporosarcina sp. P16a]PIC90167.1 hypothetical protein CSV71_05540 [Sporosarcina sp. P21c]PIC91910.1 hypothetical protein CSV70_13500 [Sporosarcina sp. P25]